MKKQEFIRELKKELERVPSHVRDEILADINEHFSEGIAQGMTEEEVCRNLGQPGTIAAQALEEYGEYERQSKSDGSGFSQAIDDISQSIGSIGQTLSQAFTGFAHNFDGHDHDGNERVGGGYDINRDMSFGNAIRDIDIKLTDSVLRFVPASDGICRVTMKGRSRHDRYTVFADNGTLVIRDNKPPFSFVFFFKSSLVTTVYIPAQFAGRIKARSAVGNITASDISGQLDIKAAAGNITVDNHLGPKVRINTAAGNAAINLSSNRVDEADISSAAGSVKLTAGETGRLSLSSAAGNVDAKINRLGGDTYINTAAGSVNLTAREVAGNIDISTGAGSAKVYLPVDANCRIEARKPGVGSLKNELTGNPHSPYVLRASSGVGSIRLLAL
jgi:hypothetical protein